MDGLEVIEEITGLLDVGGAKEGFHQPGRIKFRIVFKHCCAGQEVDPQRTDALQEALHRHQSFRTVLAHPG